MQIVLSKNILRTNEKNAESNRARLDAAKVLGVNILGSPGAGKTTLLEALIPKLKDRLRMAVIEGDLATTKDAERIEALGVTSIQVNTDRGCHLDAAMVSAALDALTLANLDVVFIENVGNLVCTAGFALGERLRIVVLSVAEGDDKVEKYPPMFRKADAVFLNKIDLLPYTNFDIAKARSHIQRLSPNADVFELSPRTGAGMTDCAEWIVRQKQKST